MGFRCRRRRGWCAASLLFWGAVSVCLAGSGDRQPDLADLTLQELMEIQVATVQAASGFSQKVTEAPSAVTIVTAEEIRLNGYRTLAEVLAAARGFFITTDRNYTYAGVRGFNRTGDYNDRILLLVDGHRLNDPYYEQAFLGHDNPIDIELVERVEIVRGPGSALYGGNAFFAVINLVTRRPGDLPAVLAAVQAGSHGHRRGQAALAGRLGEQASGMLAVSRLDADGQDLYFPEWDAPETGHGRTRNTDYERASHFFLKGEWGPWILEAGRGVRIKGNPTGLFGSRFGDPSGFSRDERSFAFLEYARQWGDSRRLGIRVFQDWYRYRGDYPYDGEERVIINRSLAHGSARGLAAHLDWGSPDRSMWKAGIEYINRYRQNQVNFDLRPAIEYWEDEDSIDSAAFFLENQWKISPRWMFNGGARLDQIDRFGMQASPRLALIWTPRPSTPVKFLAGRAFRAPNPYEFFFNEGYSTPQLNPEKITTLEVVVEQFWASGWRWSGSVYTYEIKDLIETRTESAWGEGLLFNSPPVRARGLEIEIEKNWKDGRHFRASYALQSARLSLGNGELDNSPRQLFKLNAAWPLSSNWSLAGEGQYQSTRTNPSGPPTGACALAHLNLTGANLLPGLEFSLRVANLADRRCYDPGFPEDVIRRFELDGRTWRASIRWQVK